MCSIRSTAGWWLRPLSRARRRARGLRASCRQYQRLDFGIARAHRFPDSPGSRLLAELRQTPPGARCARPPPWREATAPVEEEIRFSRPRIRAGKIYDRCSCPMTPDSGPRRSDDSGWIVLRCSERISRAVVRSSCPRDPSAPRGGSAGPHARRQADGGDTIPSGIVTRSVHARRALSRSHASLVPLPAVAVASRRQRAFVYP